MKKFSKAIMLIALIFGMLCAGCGTTTYWMSLDSLTEGMKSKDYTYTILSSDSAVPDDDLAFAKLKKMLKDSLVESGFKVEDDAKNADAVILFSAASTPFTKTYSGGGSDTYYRITANVVAHEYEPASKNKGTMLWKMDVLSEVGWNNLQRYFSRYVKGMGKYYGKDSNGRRTLQVEVSDKTGEVVEVVLWGVGKL